MEFKKILFPTDFSACSKQGLDFATELARGIGAMLVIVHVEESGETYEGPYYGVSDERRAALQEQLNDTRPDDPAIQFEHRYLQGSPAHAIANAAKRESVDLIVMPTHGRRGLKHLLMGSVAEGVVRAAPCPVVTFRPGAPKLKPRVALPQLRPLSRDEVREIDRRAIEELSTPGPILMENAGRGAADLLERLGIDGTVVIVAGGGNNGGDGFVIARHLDCRGYPVRVLLLGNAAKLSGEAAINWKIIEDAGLPCQQLDKDPNLVELESIIRNSAWTVDALLGTGTHGDVREPFSSVIDCLNKSAHNILAIDLPSGLDCDTGKPLGSCIKAAHTATFVARKKGFDVPGASAYTGEVHVIDIGVPRILLDTYRSTPDSRT